VGKSVHGFRQGWTDVDVPMVIHDLSPDIKCFPSEAVSEGESQKRHMENFCCQTPRVAP